MTEYGYGRVSSGEQKKSGLSIESQDERLEALGIDKINRFSDAGKTAGVKEDMINYVFKEGHYIIDINLNSRPDFVKLNNIMTSGDSLKFTRWDRISRSSILLSVFRHDCERRGITLIPLEDAKEDLTIKIVAIVNEHLLGSIAESNDLVFEQKYNQGAFPYKAPIGYIKNTKDKEGKLKFPTYPESYLLLDTDKMWIVHEVFNKMAQGEYYKDICKELKINSQTLYDIVRNKTYLGMTHYGNEWKKSDAVPQVIAQEIFDKSNQNIKVKK